jgi:hypothetical protein
MSDKEALKLALEALKQMQTKANFECWNLDICDEAIKALKKALAKQEEGKSFFKFRECEDSQANQPKQEQGEPVAQCCSAGIAHDCHADDGCRIVERIKTVNTTPQQRTWVGLTDEQIKAASLRAGMQEHYMDFHSGCIRFAQAIEAKLKEKNSA